MLRLSLGLLCFLLAASPLAAQTTGDGTTPPKEVQEQSLIDKAKALLHNNLRDKLAPYNGFYVQYGFSEKPPGSSVGFGGGWRHDVFDRRARIETEVGISIRNYRLLRADFAFPKLADGLIEVAVGGSYRYQPQDDFYGLGMNTSLDDRTNFLLEAVDLNGRMLVKPAPGVQFGTRAGRLNIDIGRGHDDRYPSVERRFSNATAPGLTLQPDYGYADVFALLDRRVRPGNPRGGGLYSVQLRRYADLDFNRYSFTAFDLDLQQFIPLPAEHVIALRGHATTTTAGAENEVPFYFQPTLGGGITMRSARDYRFRDRNVMFANVEYRFTVRKHIDLAAFTDLGKVAPRAHDLSFQHLKHAYGGGIRFTNDKAIIFRFDVANGGEEGMRYIFKFSKPF